MTEQSVPPDDLISLANQEGKEPPGKLWRWWVHLLVIGIYPLLGLFVHSGHAMRGPVLSSTARGLLTVSTVEIILFALVFTLGWLASRASSEELLLHWRPGWWVVPLGIVYSIAIRFVLGLIVMIGGIFLVITRVFSTETLQQFVDTNRPKVEALVSVSALEHNSSYFWLMVSVVSFVVAGLREELWRAATLAAFRKLWPKPFASPTGQYFAVALIARQQPKSRVHPCLYWRPLLRNQCCRVT